MLLPMLPAGMQQGHRCARDWIQGRGGRGCAEVAGGTGQAPILWIIAPVGINVLNMHRLANDVSTRLTVFTTMASAFVDQTHDGCP
jgi:hypothetical protein